VGQKSGRTRPRKSAVCRRILYRGEHYPSFTHCYDAKPSQVGIGAPISPENAIKWYKLAAENGDKRAASRLANFSKAGIKASGAGATREELLARAAAADGDSTDSGGKRDKDCVIM
jgi:hypothetical protein